MNKFNLKSYLSDKLGGFEATLKATSFDAANQQYVCHDEVTHNVYDFDRYVRERCGAPTPASPDAVYIGDRNLYFVEFKNQNLGEVNKENIERKFRSGTSILIDLLGGFGAKDCRYHFCVVLKGQSMRRIGMDARHIQNNVLRFQLERLNREQGNFYDTIVAESVDFYVKEYKGLRCS